MKVTCMGNRKLKRMLIFGIYTKSLPTVMVAIVLVILISPNTFASSLHDAAKKGNIKNLEELASVNNIDLDQVDRNGLTPLHCAAALGHFEAVKFLVRKGARVDSKSATGITPLL